MPDNDDQYKQYLDQEIDELPEDMPALIRDVPDISVAPAPVPVQNDEYSLKELLIRLLYNMPIQDNNFCLMMQQEINQLHMENNLHMNPYTEDTIHRIIHAENDPLRFMIHFKDKLIISDKVKKILVETINRNDLYDKDELYGIVKPYLELLDKIPIG
jgi:hypothetical protein